MSLLTLRPVREDDSRDIWNWRNDEHSRAMFLNSNPVAWEEHANWFSKTLANPNRTLLIGELGGESAKVGVCRFDHDEKTGLTEVSINLNPAMRGRGLATSFLRLSVEQESQRHSKLTATVRKNNPASIKIFLNAGFQLARQDAENNYYVKNVSTS